MSRQIVTPLLAGWVVALVILSSVPVAAAQATERCFDETGYCVSGRILAYWEQNGGLPVFGFPISPQREELIEGQPRQVQWFERNRLELHPENAPPYDVLLGRLGGELVATQDAPAPETPQAGCRYSEQTGFNICGEILAYWNANGLEIDGQPGTTAAESIALFGLPLTGTYETTLPDGNVITVQWFERARFELHPQNAPPYNVLLGRLGFEVAQPDLPGEEAAIVSAVRAHVGDTGFAYIVSNVCIDREHAVAGIDPVEPGRADGVLAVLRREAGQWQVTYFGPGVSIVAPGGFELASLPDDFACIRPIGE